MLKKDWLYEQMNQSDIAGSTTVTSKAWSSRYRRIKAISFSRLLHTIHQHTIFHWGLALPSAMSTSTPHPDSTSSSHLISSPHQTVKPGQPFPKSCNPPRINLSPCSPAKTASILYHQRRRHRSRG